MIVFFDTWAKLWSTVLFVLWWIVSFLGGIHYYMKDPWSKEAKG